MKIDQILIFGIVTDTFFNLPATFVNDTQIILVNTGRTIKNLIDKTHFFLRGKITHTPFFKRLQYRCLFTAHRDNDTICQNNT